MTPSLPLAGIRVIEFSHMVMGPTCGMILGDLGAEVIKVEPPGKGDRTRYLIASGAGFFPGLNRNKKSVQIDTDAADDVETLKRLTDTADVVIENFRPGGLDAKGLGYDALSARNPRVIYLSLKGYLPGPYENRTALDEVVQMQAGLAYMTGPVGRPLRAGAPVNDMMGGMFGVIAVMGALRQRETTGRGQHLQSGLFENAAFLMSTTMLQQALSGQEPPPMPAGRRSWGVYDVFDTKDGQQIFIGVVTDRQWEIFRRELQEPALDSPDYATNTERAKRRAVLIPLVQSLLIRHDIATLEAMCERAGLPFSRIAKPWDLFEDPHLMASGGLLPITMADGRAAAVPALPIQFGPERLGVRLNPPAVGEHDEEILGPHRARPDAAE
ncbi:CoA transferase [Roseomonas terrae]|jgi:crotonobetainyl-CoA:carnitine CoA-transferase CaiB-like acyl-CoA transferase|uniref:CoA transferase n=1 Tax=Neoroseomonas terrae TaxID=424799 RepID=A0ABS5EB85_9PROT|nr:CaiB/BaiF CoA-transferase family protein [Neoroseomonas terrae]MBR0648291.1 CoA transferase [Neoroseomonas terrae]